MTHDEITTTQVVGILASQLSIVDPTIPLVYQPATTIGETVIAKQAIRLTTSNNIDTLDAFTPGENTFSLLWRPPAALANNTVTLQFDLSVFYDTDPIGYVSHIYTVSDYETSVFDIEEIPLYPRANDSIRTNTFLLDYNNRPAGGLNIGIFIGGPSFEVDGVPRTVLRGVLTVQATWNVNVTHNTTVPKKTITVQEFIDVLSGMPNTAPPTVLEIEGEAGIIDGTPAFEAAISEDI